MKVKMFARVVQLPTKYTKAGEQHKQRVGITTNNSNTSGNRTTTGYNGQNKSTGVCKGCGG